MSWTDQQIRAAFRATFFNGLALSDPWERRDVRGPSFETFMENLRAQCEHVRVREVVGGSDYQYWGTDTVYRCKKCGDVSTVPTEKGAPVTESCGCDGAVDDGCYHCRPKEWRCWACGYPLVRDVDGRYCPKCRGEDFTPEQWCDISFSGRKP